MATKKHGLGRGLNALLMGARTTQAETELEASVAKDSSSNASSGLLEVALQDLSPSPYQPRQKIHAEDLEGLADSIRAQGIIQPIVARQLSNGKYEIIAGERRFRAAALAGMKQVPVVVKQVSEEAAMAMALIENIQRENLNAIEEALALERLSKEFKLTHIEVAQAIGKSRTSITNSLRLLTLVEDVKVLLERGEIEVGHAKVLLGLRGREQSEIARIVVAKGLSVRETERLVTQNMSDKTDGFIRKPSLDPNVKRLQQDISERIGAVVEIQQAQNGKGKLVIQYNSLEELEGILEHIK